jgi:hypothetical protein
MDAMMIESAGLFGSGRARASVKESFGMPGTAAPERLLTVRLFDSLEFEVLPGRGFDLGDTWLRGIPLSWFSPVRDARALPSPTGTEWLTRFTGGLLTTCGFGTIGSPGNGEGLHGTASHLPADEVSWRISEQGAVSLDGVIESVALFGASFRVRRSIHAAPAGEGMSRLTITDAVTNIGPEEAPLSMLYHLNFGAPLVAPGSSVLIDSATVTASAPHPEVPDWSVLPEPARHLAEAVFEHTGVAVGANGLARATVLSSARDLGVVVEWSPGTLPRLHQWVFPARGRWALGIEPATAPLFGPDRAGDHAGAPVIAPGQCRVQEVRISVGSRDEAAHA